MAQISVDDPGVHSGGPSYRSESITEVIRVFFLLDSTENTGLMKPSSNIISGYRLSKESRPLSRDFTSIGKSSLPPDENQSVTFTR